MGSVTYEVPAVSNFDESLWFFSFVYYPGTLTCRFLLYSFSSSLVIVL